MKGTEIYKDKNRQKIESILVENKDKPYLTGFYRYKTSPTMTGEWIIAGKMKINRILSDDEVEILCLEAGYEPLGREHQLNLREYGFAV